MVMANLWLRPIYGCGQSTVMVNPLVEANLWLRPINGCRQSILLLRPLCPLQLQFFKLILVSQSFFGECILKDSLTSWKMTFSISLISKTYWLSSVHSFDLSVVASTNSIGRLTSLPSMSKFGVYPVFLWTQLRYAAVSIGKCFSQFV